MKTKIQDMTSGSPGRLIILFAIPLMLGNICQQLYTMVDTMVVGQIAGVEALAALGAVDFLMWVVTGISTGLTQGFSIQLAQYYGAKDFENLRKSLAHSYRLTAFIAVGVFILSQSFAALVLTGLHTPSNIIGMSLLYLRIIFCGIPATAAYNMFAAALRAMGNSKTPLSAMIIASVLNISLDILFVAGFGWGVAGAAIATVIAQSFSAVYCFLILRRIDIVHLSRADFMSAAGMNARLMKLGIPVVFQNIIIGVGGLVVLRECLAGEEGFYCMTRRQCEQILNLCREENYAIGIFTLGSRVDELENRYSSTERLREAYAVETICWELLRKGYDMFQRWAEAHLKQRLESYHFFGSEEGLPFEKMAQLLAEMGQNRITCNQAYCMEPKKSVMFLAEFSGGSLKVESKRNFREKSGKSSGAGVKWNAAETEKCGDKSTGICASCSNKECAYRR